jgi:hypothetical protein
MTAAKYKLYRNQTECDSGNWGVPYGKYQTLHGAMAASGLPDPADWHTMRYCPDEVFTADALCRPDARPRDAWHIRAPGAAAESIGLRETA